LDGESATERSRKQKRVKERWAFYRERILEIKERSLWTKGRKVGQRGLYLGTKKSEGGQKKGRNKDLETNSKKGPIDKNQPPYIEKRSYSMKKQIRKEVGPPKNCRGRAR